MPESEQERLTRLYTWLRDLELLIQQAELAKDEMALEAATIMRSECENFIAEAQKNIARET